MMRIRVLEELPDWNFRVYDEADFQEICLRKKIKVIESALVSRGLYCVYSGQEFIVIDPNLSAGMKAWVCWHELGHAILHKPYLNHFSIDPNRQNQQANVVAAVALIPISILLRNSIIEIVEEYKYPLELARYRIKVYERLKI